MRLAPLGILLACIAVAGCGGDEERAQTTTVAYSDFVTQTTIVDPEELERTFTANQPAPYDPPPGEPANGRRVVAQAGCLACHQIGASGNSGPGSNLDGIGDRLPGAAIRRSLLDPRAPMPSYRALAPDKLDALVTYLSSLRADCPNGSDCG